MDQTLSDFLIDFVEGSGELYDNNLSWTLIFGLMLYAQIPIDLASRSLEICRLYAIFHGAKSAM
jgi:hypothetical protein